MIGLGLIVGHLVGDYLLQNDWMASNKSNPHPGPEPYPQRIWLRASTPRREYPGPWTIAADPADLEAFRTALEDRNRKVEEWNAAEDARLATPDIDAALTAQQEWWAKRDRWREGALACALHCTLYTLAVWACSFWWMPWWGLLACWACHYPLDRYRLARWWMENVSGQRAFASGPLAPWSVIIVDNTLHLLTLLLIAAAAGRC